LGTVPEGGSGWQISTEINAQTGQIGIDLYSTTPITNPAGGSLVVIALQVRDNAPVGATALTLVPWVDPSGGMRVFQTQLSGPEGEFILHQSVTPSGVEPGEPGQVTIAEFSSPLSPPGRGVGGEGYASAFDVTPTAAPVTEASSVSTPPQALMEQVFGNLDQTGQVARDSAQVQPGVILNSQTGIQSLETNHDLAILAVPASQPDWVSDDYLAYLSRAARRGLPNVTFDLLDSATTADGTDADAVDAFFSREGAKK
jgi:hypothetical protein